MTRNWLGNILFRPLMTPCWLENILLYPIMIPPLSGEYFTLFHYDAPLAGVYFTSSHNDPPGWGIFDTSAEVAAHNGRTLGQRRRDDWGEQITRPPDALVLCYLGLNELHLKLFSLNKSSIISLMHTAQITKLPCAYEEKFTIHNISRFCYCL